MGRCGKYLPTTRKLLSSVTHLVSRRNQWYHRNSATEFMGIVYGDLGHGRSELLPGGANFGTNFAPHGVDHDVYKMATEANLRPMIIHKGAVGTSPSYFLPYNRNPNIYSAVFVMESSITFTMTDYAMHKSGKLRSMSLSLFVFGLFLIRYSSRPRDLECFQATLYEPHSRD